MAVAKARPKIAAKPPVPRDSPGGRPIPKAALDKIPVKNTSKKRVNLTRGGINPGDRGLATRAELSTLHAHIERL